MRRDDLLKLVGLSREAFNQMRKRDVLPLPTARPEKGWGDYSFDDAWAIMIALDLAAGGAERGVSQKLASLLVNGSWSDLIAFAGKRRRRSGDLLYGAAYLADIDLDADDSAGVWIPLVGTTALLLSELDSLERRSGPKTGVRAVYLANASTALRTLKLRADRAGLADNRLIELCRSVGVK